MFVVRIVPMTISSFCVLKSGAVIQMTQQRDGDVVCDLVLVEALNMQRRVFIFIDSRDRGSTSF